MFGTLFYVSVLCLNAVAILNEERFLSRIGWSSAALHYEQQHSFGGSPTGESSIKERIVTLISAVRTLLRVPLAVLNIIIIVWELLRF